MADHLAPDPDRWAPRLETSAGTMTTNRIQRQGRATDTVAPLGAPAAPLACRLGLHRWVDSFHTFISGGFDGVDWDMDGGHCARCQAPRFPARKV
jgi:hypothetical protein